MEVSSFGVLKTSATYLFRQLHRHVTPDKGGVDRTLEQGALLSTPSDGIRRQPTQPHSDQQVSFQTQNHVSFGHGRRQLARIHNSEPTSPRNGDQRAESSTQACSRHDAIIHTRRPAAWAQLSDSDAAILDFLRHGATSSELPPDETSKRILMLMAEKGRFERLLDVADTNHPECVPC